jgi:hypothetical protein
VKFSNVSSIFLSFEYVRNTTVTKDLKREGKGAVTHYPPIEETDIRKMYDYFNVNDNVKLQRKVFVDVMRLDL